MHDPARKVGATVFPELRKHFWRRAIGLIAAYAFVLQSLLALSMVTQAAAAGSLSHGGTFFVLCLNDDSAAKNDASAPVKPVTHCPACTLATASGVSPEPVLLPEQLSYIEQRTPFITAEACIAFHQARSGLTRAPPQNV